MKYFGKFPFLGCIWLDAPGDLSNCGILRATRSLCFALISMISTCTWAVLPSVHLHMGPAAFVGTLTTSASRFRRRVEVKVNQRGAGKLGIYRENRALREEAEARTATLIDAARGGGAGEGPVSKAMKFGYVLSGRPPALTICTSIPQHEFRGSANGRARTKDCISCNDGRKRTFSAAYSSRHAA
eukprot:IDg7946t1